MVLAATPTTRSSSKTASTMKNFRLFLVGMAAVFVLVELFPGASDPGKQYAALRRRLAFFDPETTDPKDVPYIPAHDTVLPQSSTTTTTAAAATSETTNVDVPQQVVVTQNPPQTTISKVTTTNDYDAAATAIELENEGIEMKANAVLTNMNMQEETSGTIATDTTTGGGGDTTTPVSTTTTRPQEEEEGTPVSTTSGMSQGTGTSETDTTGTNHQETPVAVSSSSTNTDAEMSQGTSTYSSGATESTSPQSSSSRQEGTSVSATTDTSRPSSSEGTPISNEETTMTSITTTDNNQPAVSVPSLPADTTTTSSSTNEPSYTRLCRELIARNDGNKNNKNMHYEPFVVEESPTVCTTQESYAAIGTMYLSSLIAQAGSTKRVWYSHNCAASRPPDKSITSIQEWFPDDLTFGIGIGQKRIVDRCRKCLNDMDASGRIMLECMGFPNPGHLVEPTDPMIHAFRMAGFRHNLQQAAHNFKEHELQMWAVMNQRKRQMRRRLTEEDNGETTATTTSSSGTTTSSQGSTVSTTTPSYPEFQGTTASTPSSSTATTGTTSEGTSVVSTAMTSNNEEEATVPALSGSETTTTTATNTEESSTAAETTTSSQQQVSTSEGTPVVSTTAVVEEEATTSALSSSSETTPVVSNTEESSTAAETTTSSQQQVSTSEGTPVVATAMTSNHQEEATTPTLSGSSETTPVVSNIEESSTAAETTSSSQQQVSTSVEEDSPNNKPSSAETTTAAATTTTSSIDNHKSYGGAVIVLDTERETDPSKDKSWIIPFYVYEEFLTNTTLTKGIQQQYMDDDKPAPSSISVLVMQRCIDSNPLCKVHGQELVKRFQTLFPSPNTVVSGEIVQSTASLYGRIMDAPLLFCPTPTMTCILPSLMREYSKTTILTHSRELYDWYEWSIRESRKIVHAPVILYDEPTSPKTPLAHGEVPAQSVPSLLDVKKKT